MKIKIALFALFIGIIACNRGGGPVNDRKTIEVIDLLSEPESEITSLSEIATDIEYISLQTSSTSMIKFIRKVIISENRIYVQNNVEEILCFDKDGNFLYKLSKQGRGPGEYTFISDFSIDSVKNTLIILDGAEILEYENTGSEFILMKSVKLNRPAPQKIDIIPGSNKVMLSIPPFKGSEPSLSIMINMDGDTVYYKPNCYQYERKIAKGGMVVVSANETVQYVHDNKICFKEVFSDTVFYADKESDLFLPHLIFNSYGKMYPARAKGDPEFAKSNGDEYYYIANIMEVPRYLVYYYYFDKSPHKILYDKVSSHKFDISLDDHISEDIAGGPFFDPAGVTSGKFYSFVEASSLKRHVSKEEFATVKVKNPARKEELIKLAGSLEETDNPVLVVVTPKK